MLKIKLIRQGKRNSPTYRVVVQEAKQKATGRTVANLGFFIPKEGNKQDFTVNKEAYSKWIKLGATPTSSVLDLISGKYAYSKYNPKAKTADKSLETKKDGES